jgi:hypothetical protein
MWGMNPEGRMDGKATDFIIDDGELVPVEQLQQVEDMDILGTVVLRPKDPEEFMKMMMALKGLSDALRLQ